MAMKPQVRRWPSAISPRRIEPEACATLEAILDDFTESWERGDRPRAEGYLALLPPEDSAELIYHEYCLAEATDLGPDPPDPAAYLERFPEHADALGRLFALHGALPASMLRAWVEPAELPSAGDEIGPYELVRELGRGAFARVFLAEQTDLDHRLVVVKVSAGSTAEPRLLARARHAHIVEVLRHVAADDGALHLVCMPFLGGATLASVLDGRRKLGGRPRSGRDLLADLDRASASEYPAPGMSRPARDVIAGHSFPGAIAWIVARLAEALDHAHRRGVVHGDVKPSNILLTAEATPMLFDFNLAVDKHGVDPGWPASDAGGTLAYMAPERLRVIAGIRDSIAGRPVDLHRADLYALGLVLLESLTGRSPELPIRKASDPRAMADALVRSRCDLPKPLSGRSRSVISPTLRSILAKCLAPDPADRYARGDELAEDLDRWRLDRPLVFAEESRRSALVRRARRSRQVLTAGGLTLATAVTVGFVASILLQGSKRDQALSKLSAVVSRADPDVFPFHSLGDWSSEPGDTAETAARQLARYGVEAEPDWRDRVDVVSLPGREREELDTFIYEQILRMAVALGKRPDSPGDWRRALYLVERTTASMPLAALRAEALTLRLRLKLPAPEALPADAPRPPRWLEDYMDGVAAEPLQAREARDHYLDALRHRPDLFWAHYRAACAACRIDEYPQAADHLRRCVARQPSNPALHVQLAALLFKQERDTHRQDLIEPFADALAECDRALDLDPDFAEANSTRAMILRASGREGSVRAEVARFALLTRFRGPVPSQMLRMKSDLHYGPNYAVDVFAVEAHTRKALATAPENHDARAILAASLALGGRKSEALDEYRRVIEANPEHLRARYQRAILMHDKDPSGMIAELSSLIDHPRFEELLREQPTAIRAFHWVANDLADLGRVPEALELAQRSLAHAHRSRSLRNETILARLRAGNQAELSPRGESNYLLARILAPAARTDPGHFQQMVDHLQRSFHANKQFRESWFVNDRKFDGIRDEILERVNSATTR